jgi:hypothetical protein
VEAEAPPGRLALAGAVALPPGDVAMKVLFVSVLVVAFGGVIYCIVIGLLHR